MGMASPSGAQRAWRVPLAHPRVPCVPRAAGAADTRCNLFPHVHIHKLTCKLQCYRAKTHQNANGHFEGPIDFFDQSF